MSHLESRSEYSHLREQLKPELEEIIQQLFKIQPQLVKQRTQDTTRQMLRGIEDNPWSLASEHGEKKGALLERYYRLTLDDNTQMHVRVQKEERQCTLEIITMNKSPRSRILAISEHISDEEMDALISNDIVRQHALKVLTFGSTVYRIVESLEMRNRRGSS